MNTPAYGVSKALKDGQTLDINGHIQIGAAWDLSARNQGGVLGRLSRRMGGELDALAIDC
ncbi:hypothetical protein ABT282_08245 [Streptomyces sp. NPDC000927]|uniref:hypothetical protein n=1 Tax=Streptomyces sp. NPDC000927 TaxID=3154371 RepID=UPI0033341653